MNNLTTQPADQYVIRGYLIFCLWGKYNQPSPEDINWNDFIKDVRCNISPTIYK